MAIDLVSARLVRARPVASTWFTSTFATQEQVVDGRSLTGGRGPDTVIDAVGMEAHGSPATKSAHRMTALIPNALKRADDAQAGVDRLAALQLAIELVRQGGTISSSACTEEWQTRYR